MIICGYFTQDCYVKLLDLRAKVLSSRETVAANGLILSLKEKIVLKFVHFLHIVSGLFQRHKTRDVGAEKYEKFS